MTVVAEKSVKKPRGRPSCFDREKVLIQVMDLFWSHGFKDLSFNEIAKATGLTRASLYNAFESKEALFFEALDHYFASAPNNILLEVEKGDPIGPVFYSMFHEAARLYSSDPNRRGCMGVNCINELMGGQEKHQLKITGVYEDLKKQLKRLIAQAIQQKELPSDTDAESTAHIILTFMNGFGVFSKSKTSEKQLVKLADTFLAQIGF